MPGRVAWLMAALVAIAGTVMIAAPEHECNECCVAPQEQSEEAGQEMAEHEFPFQLSDEEWRERLTEEQYRVLREGGTECAFSGEYYEAHEDGIYHCAGCGNELFDSADKFDSGTGWPSFTRPISEDALVEREDRSHGMIRTEILCANCGGHLGHVFSDGPDPTGLRHCINSVALKFEPRAEQPSAAE